MDMFQVTERETHGSDTSSVTLAELSSENGSVPSSNSEPNRRDWNPQTPPNVEMHFWLVDWNPPERTAEERARHEPVSPKQVLAHNNSFKRITIPRDSFLRLSSPRVNSSHLQKQDDSDSSSDEYIPPSDGKVLTKMVNAHAQRQHVFSSISPMQQSHLKVSLCCCRRRKTLLLPPAENCSLILWNLTSAVKNHHLFAAINTGAVACLHIVTVDVHGAPCIAALVTFKTPQDAAGLKEQADSQNGIWVMGNKLVALYDEEGCRAIVTTDTRVLTITTNHVIKNNYMMTRKYWSAFFAQFFFLDVDCVVSEKDNEQEHDGETWFRVVLQFRFASLHQARMGMKAYTEHPTLDHESGILMNFGRDLCDGGFVGV